MDTKAEYFFGVRSYECGPDWNVTLATICNYLQEVATMHAETLGFSRTHFVAKGENISWILTRMHVRMYRYPHFTENVRVLTFPRGGRKIVAYRDFVISVGDEVVGVASSEWMIINLDTRKVVPVPTLVYDLANTERQPVFGDAKFAHVRWDCINASSGKPFFARRCDIDWNGHVNNVHYIEWLVEALPADAGKISDFEIAFKSETLVGDAVYPETDRVAEGVFVTRVKSSDGHDHAIARFVTGDVLTVEETNNKEMK